MHPVLCFVRFRRALLPTALFVILNLATAVGQNEVPYFSLRSENVAGSGVDLPIGLNNRADMTGFNPANNHAFYSVGFPGDFGALPNNPSYSVGASINDSQYIAGWSLVNGYTHGMWAGPGIMPTDIGTLGRLSTSSSFALGINNNQVLVGKSTTATGTYHAFSWNGHMTDLGAFKGGYSEARGINNAGQIVGDSTTVLNQKFHAFLYSNGTMRDLGTLGGTDSYGMAINNAGTVVGYSYIPNNTAMHAFVYTNSMLDLPTLGGDMAQATAINDFGTVVGWSYTANDAAKHAFLYSPSINGVLDLNDVIASSSVSGWTLNSAWAVNNRGEIAGYATDASGQTHIYRLEPAVPGSNCTPSSYTTAFADVTGDHRADAITVNTYGIAVLRANIIPSTNAGGFGPVAEAWSTVKFSGLYNVDGIAVGNIFFADVDGDGKADAIAVSDSGVTVRRSDGTKFLSNETWATGLIASSYHINGVSYPNIYFVDVNNDGAADAVTVDDNGVWVRLADKVNHLFQSPAINWTGGAFYGTKGTFFADVTGDGAADAIAVNTNLLGSAVITVRPSNWTSFLANQTWPSFSYIPTAFANLDGAGGLDEVMNRGSSGIVVGQSVGSSFKFRSWTASAFYGDIGTYYADVDNDPNYPNTADAIAVNHNVVYVRRSTGGSLNAQENWSGNIPFFGTHDPTCH